MEVKEIQRLLSDRNLREISRRTSIGYSTLRSIVKNKDADPSISTVKKLMEYFSATCPSG
jgi:predicted transcriptional regulator